MEEPGGTSHPHGADDAESREGPPPPGEATTAPHVRGLRVIVAMDDSSNALRVKGLLKEQGAVEVAVVAGAEEFRSVLSDASRWHVALWDERLEPDPVRLTGMLDTWRREFPRTAVVLAVDVLTPESTLTALRGGATDIVRREESGPALVGVVRHAHNARDALSPDAGRAAPRMLVVGAHPDDGEIGAGGIVHRRVRDGWQVSMLAMSHGSGGGDPALRAEEARRAAAVLGAEFFLEDFPDGHIPDETETVQAIERVIERIVPDVVLVHALEDTHQDHRAVHRATLVAARRVPRISCYQSPSATVDYSPNRFIGLTEADIEAKLAAIAVHGSQASTRAYLDAELIRSTARYWGRFTGDTFAEPLRVMRYNAETRRSLV